METQEIILVLSIKLNFQKELNCITLNNFLISKIYEETLKTEVNRLIDIGTFKCKNNSECVTPTFIINKKNGTVSFISDFRELNKTIRRIPFSIQKIQYLLFRLEVFKLVSSLDLNMGYYYIILRPFSRAKTMYNSDFQGGK